MKSRIFYENNLELIDYGTFIHFNQKEPVTLTVSEDDGTNLSVRLEFVYDKDAGEKAFDFSQYNNYTLNLKVTHKGHLTNYGYVNPVKVGTFNGHELYFNIRVDINSIEDSPLIHYSWFKGQKTV
jgi:hypothetical protein